MLLLIVACKTNAFAQRIITGRVSDYKQDAVVGAIITLINNEDSVVLSNVLSDSSGFFQLTVPDSESKRLLISALGYKSVTRGFDPETDYIRQLEFILEETNQSLDEVTVSAARPLFERKPDRLIYNVSASAGVAGNNVLDMIRKAPGVSVRQNDYTISLIGKGSVLVMINDRLVQLSGEDLFNYLQAMPAENLDRIEVITTPPARYDASGNSGLINIVLKKNNRKGFNGNVRLAYEQASYGKVMTGGDANYRSGGINLYGNLNYTNGSNQIIENLNTPYPGQMFQVTDDYKKTIKPLQYTLGLDYDITKHAVLGILWNSNKANRTDDANDVIKVLKTPLLTQDSSMVTKARSQRNSSNNVLNINYAWTIDTLGKTLNINANRLWFNGNRSNDFTTINYLGESLTPTGVQSHNASNGNQDITITTAQADLDLPLSFAALSLGGKLSFIDNNSRNIFGYFDQDGYHENPAVSNGFEYSECVQALYFSAQKSLGKWSFQAGLRGEFTQTKGYALSLNQTNTNQYFNFFPTAYIQYHPSKNHSWNLNYSKRINRPDYRSLDPYRAYATPYHYSEGNPFLLPSFNHNFELAYTLKSHYTFSATYEYQQNHFGSVWEIDEVNNITSGISMNFAGFTSYSINAVGTFNPFKWWEIQAQIGAQAQQLKSKVYSAAERSYTAASAYASVNSNFSLNKSGTLTGEANFFLLSKHREDFLEIKSMGSFYLGLKALLFDRKFIVGLNAADIFATLRAKGTHVVTGQTINNYFDARHIRLSLSYKFGNSKVKARRQRSTGIEDEKGRAE
jgi:hypothetical protein